MRPATGIPPRNVERFSQGLLDLVPQGEPVAPALPDGLSALGLGGARDGLVWKPPGLPPGGKAPLAVMLHGAGGGARQMTDMLLALPGWRRVLLLAVESRGATWDVILGGYGPDIAFLNEAISHVAAREALDPAHLAIGGFSDGASYGLSVALNNGDLFTHALAFSPGFLASTRHADHPRFFVSHGRQDEVLPIGRCSRQLVPQLQRAGYRVTYREFDGPHVVPAAVAEDALGWFLDGLPP